MRIGIRSSFTVILFAIAATTLRAADPAQPDAETARFFTAEVRPILTDSCFKCHGGEAKIKGGLRLTSRAGALRGGDTGPAIDEKNPTDSLLLKMISYSDDDHQMPPKAKLAQAKIDVLTKWVKLGAPWSGEQAPLPEIVAAPGGAPKPTDEEAKNYWAYKKPLRPALPPVKNAAWVRSPVDAFVLARLEAKGLKPAVEADRRVLIRRATYDLTGLPPSPDEVDAFVKDSDATAYEKLIDRLLSSPHYGEKWGRYWLDLVGFAETNGYERDGDKPNAWRYRDYVIRAFNQDTPYDQFVREQLAGDQLEHPSADAIIATGYYRLGLWDDEPADHDQAHYDYFDGIVSTTAQAMLGMTMGCARCHNHKKDPILQEDYYRMLAFFHGMRDSANVETVIAQDEKEHQIYHAKLKEQQEQLDAIEAEFEKRLRAAGGKATGADIEDLTYRFYRGSWTQLPKFDELKAESEGKLPAGFFDITPATRHDDFGFVFTGMLVVPQDGHYLFNLDSDDGSRLTIAGKQVAEYDGVHGTGTPHKGEIDLKKGRVPIRLDYFQGHNGLELIVGWSGPGVAGRSLSSQPSTTSLSDAIGAQGAAVLGKDGFARYQTLRKALDELKRNPPQDGKALSVGESNAIDTFVLARGNAHVKGKQVQPGFPRVIGTPDPAMPKDGKSGLRLALANWIVGADNPLSARVMANRLWQFHFGKGIVSTANDFGRFGQLPSNQELLDWLATEFVARGWKIKAMHRLLMTSNAYRMASQDDAAGLTKDPENDLLWRYAMRRLTAEEIRDSILAVDGTLNLAMGGPSVYPPMPKEVLATSSKPNEVWGHSSPEDSAKRSVYIKVKRSLLFPMLSAHDFADTDTSCPMRFSTTVSTQALTMINSEFINGEARLFAQRLKSQAPGDLDREVRLGLRLVTQRPPVERDVMRGLTFISDAQKKDNLSADQALNLFCLLLLNLNEFVYLD